MKFEHSQWDAQLKRLLNFVKQVVPRIIQTETENFVRENFRKQGFQSDKGLQKWKKRSGNRDPGRAILVKAGHLRDSIEVQIQGHRVVVTSDRSYAPLHNEGLPVVSRGKHFSMPRRTFVGPSKLLLQRIQRKIDDEFPNYVKP